MHLAIQEHWLYFGGTVYRLTWVNFDVGEFRRFHNFSRKLMHDKCNVKLSNCVFEWR